jgi:charged multivesicular body protein 3
MEEMMDDTLEMQEDEEIEEEADAEVDKVLFELTDGKLGVVGSVGTELPVRISFSSGLDRELTDFQTQEEEETERTMEQYRQQLNGLLSG